MAVSVTENLARVLSTGQKPSAELYFTVHGTTNEVVARRELALHSASVYDPYGTGLVYLPRETITVEAVSDITWNGTVRYGYTAPETDTPSETFDTTGGQQHITRSLKTLGSYKLNEDENEPPGYGGAIGVNANGDVEGVDKIVPVYQFQVVEYFESNAITNAYKGTLFRLTGKVNNASFRGFAAGECLFLGASGSQRADGKWELLFKFAASPNINGTLENPGIIIEGINVPSKKGWEYLWVQFIDVEDPQAKRLGKRVVAAYVERIYEEDNFAGLGIGV